jgi:glycosyltransferase involved in cell wall biosynthesis
MGDPSALRAGVSVVIPTYNRSALVREAVDSVLAQTHPDVEVIVVDDGSTDDTPSVLAAYGDRIRVICKENAGGTAARNTGLEAAGGEFVNVLDHDDLFRPDKIERQLRMFAARPRVSVVHCGFDRIDSAGALLDRRPRLPEGDLTTLLQYGCYIWSGGPLIRASALREVGLFDESAWSSDAELWLRLALAGHRFACVQDCLGSYRVLPDSSMRDVERTERMDMRTYERVFADPRLPKDARWVEPQAYFIQRFWLSSRYYAIGEYDDGKRNLVEAFRHRPELLERPAVLLTKLVDNALDLRVEDAVDYQARFLANLPPELAPAIEPLAGRLMGWTRVGDALRRLAADDSLAWGGLIAEALADPKVAGDGRRFVRLTLDRAMRVSGEPAEFVARAYDGLPAAAVSWRTGREDAVAHALWLSAGLDRAAGRRRRALGQAAAAVRRRPSVVREPLLRLVYSPLLRARRTLR